MLLVNLGLAEMTRRQVRSCFREIDPYGLYTLPGYVLP